VGSYLLSMPELADSELVFNEDESKQVLKFLYPASAPGISNMTAGEATRRLAQGMLIAAIDASYEREVIEQLGETIARPYSTVKALARKLRGRPGLQWFKHASQDDLLDVKIHDSVRNAIALALVSRFRIHLQAGAETSRRTGPVRMYLTLDEGNCHV
jgi:hypothetical protein